MTRPFPQLPLRACAPVLLALLGSGCALTTRNAVLPYPPEPEQGLVAVAEASPTAMPAGRAITVLPFVDRRADPTKIGNVRNGFGMKMAPIQTVNSVPGWVQEALVIELRRAGFDVTVAAVAPDSALTVGGEVLNAETDAYLSYGAQMDLTITLAEGHRVLFTRGYVGKGAGGANVGATAKSYAQALSRALQQALGQVVPDIRAATDTEPVGVVEQNP